MVIDPCPEPFETGRELTLAQLNERRLEAVRQRLAGATVADSAQRAGLSAPTVINAMAAFRRGGWDAVKVASRGRRTGQGKLLSPMATADALKAMADPAQPVWDDASLLHYLQLELGVVLGKRAIAVYRQAWGLVGVADAAKVLQNSGAAWVLGAHELLLVRPHGTERTRWWVARDRRQRVAWGLWPERVEAACEALALHWGPPGKGGLVWVGLAQGHVPAQTAQGWRVQQFPGSVSSTQLALAVPTAAGLAVASDVSLRAVKPKVHKELSMQTDTLTHLQRLEAESIHIMREVVAEADHPVMLYSIGKDSAVMLHLARKAFFPAPPPFPLLHIDTRWKFRDMYAFRARMAEETGMKLLVHINPEGIEKDINPFTHGSALHTDIMKTQGLKQALDKYGFDVAFGGARRDEEKSRAKERVFSFRSAQHRWDPKNQRPELWKLYNTRKHKDESIRVFPLSNWTELDIWQYIYLNNIPIVPLYYAAERPVVDRDGTLIMVDDHRMPLKPGEVPMMKKVRFRTLGCYPLSGAIESEADTLQDIIREMLLARQSERQGRMIDHDSTASMEKKKQEGYF